MATNILDKDHAREFNDFYSYLADKIRSKEHGPVDISNSETYKPYSQEVVNYYKSHNLYDNILEKDYANYVILLLAPPQAVSNKINDADSKMLFQNTVSQIAADKNLAFNETSRIYYSHINNIDDTINGYSRGEVLSSFKESTDNTVNDENWKVKDGVLQKDSAAMDNSSEDITDKERAAEEERLREQRLKEDRAREEREREERLRADRDREREERDREEKLRAERAREDSERTARAETERVERVEPVEHTRAVTDANVAPAAERRNLDYPTVKRIIVYHLESFGINSRNDFRKIMEGKSTPLFIISIIIGLALLTLIVIYRNTLAFGSNFFADALQTSGDAIGTSPMLILFVIFFLLLMIIVFTIFSYARFYEKRKLFLKNTPIIIKALDVDEKTFNDVIDEKFYKEKIKLKDKAFG